MDDREKKERETQRVEELSAHGGPAQTGAKTKVQNATVKSEDGSDDDKKNDDLK